MQLGSSLTVVCADQVAASGRGLYTDLLHSGSATTPRSWLSAEMLTTQLSHANTLEFPLSGTSNVALIKASDEPEW